MFNNNNNINSPHLNTQEMQEEKMEIESEETKNIYENINNLNNNCYDVDENEEHMSEDYEMLQCMIDNDSYNMNEIKETNDKNEKSMIIETKENKTETKEKNDIIDDISIIPRETETEKKPLIKDVDKKRVKKKEAKKESYPNNLINAPKRPQSTQQNIKKNESAHKRAARLSFELENKIKKIDNQTQQMDDKKKPSKKLPKYNDKECILEVIGNEMNMKKWTNFEYEEFEKAFIYATYHCEFDMKKKWIEKSEIINECYKPIGDKCVPPKFGFFFMLYLLKTKECFSFVPVLKGINKGGGLRIVGSEFYLFFGGVLIAPFKVFLYRSRN